MKSGYKNKLTCTHFKNVAPIYISCMTATNKSIIIYSENLFYVQVWGDMVA